jgi:hypothetical protein
MTSESKLGGCLVEVQSCAVSAGFALFKDKSSNSKLSLLLDPLLQCGIRAGVMRHYVGKRQKTKLLEAVISVARLSISMFEENVVIAGFAVDDHSGNVILSRARAKGKLNHQSKKVRYDAVWDDAREG